MNTPQVSPKTSRKDSAVRATHNVHARTRSEYDFTKLEDVRDYLVVRNYLDRDCASSKVFELRRLEGGTANHVYRLTETDEGKADTTIFKHAALQFKSDPSQSLDPQRMDYEAAVLEKLSQERKCCFITGTNLNNSKIEKTHVHAVDFGFYEKDIKFLNIQDGGEKNLKDAYLDLSADEVQEIGAVLGEWLATLHGNVPKTYVSRAVPGRNNNRVGMDIARFSYKYLHTILKEFGHSEELGRKINEYFGSLIEEDEECVCHGDFWPGNVVVRKDLSGRGPCVLTVIDWEMVRVGNGATDVGQFAAEAFLLDRFHGNKGLHAAFIRAYFRSSAVSYGIKERIYPWATRVAIHFAVHLAFWPTREIHWTDEKDTKTLVDLAVVVLQDAISSTPNLMVWRVFEGLSGLDIIAKEFMEKRGDPLGGNDQKDVL